MAIFVGGTAGGVAFSVEQVDGKLPQFSNEQATELRHVPFGNLNVRDWGGKLPDRLEAPIWVDDANVASFKGLVGPTPFTLVYDGTTYTSNVTLISLTGWHRHTQLPGWTAQAVFEKPPA